MTQEVTPREIRLTGRRRVVFDRTVKGVYRVAFYAPPDQALARSLEKRATRGDGRARERLEALPVNRTTGTGETLTDALVAAMSRPDPEKPFLLRRPPLPEVAQIVAYAQETAAA